MRSMDARQSQVDPYAVPGSSAPSSSEFFLSPWWVALMGAIFGWFAAIGASNGSVTGFLWPLMPLALVAGEVVRRRRRQLKSSHRDDS